MSKAPDNCIKEMRAAFGCGSSLIELYVDQDLMSQENGKLWNELAACIKWARRNEDVLADIHWVGGNPWDNSTGDGDIYGWAAWNPAKCTLTLRNSSDSEKTLTATLREILDVPPMVKKDKVSFRNSFKDQRSIPGLVGKGVDIDQEIQITLKPQEVIVLEGICEAGKHLADDDEDGDDTRGDKKKKGKKKKEQKEEEKVPESMILSGTTRCRILQFDLPLPSYGWAGAHFWQPGRQPEFHLLKNCSRVHDFLG